MVREGERGDVEGSIFLSESIWRILWKIAPPVMLAQLIQALYNIIDSYFVGKYSEQGLTALSVIFPVQLLITAFAVGTGVGVNTHMAKLYAQKKKEDADKTAGAGEILAIFLWLLTSALSLLLLKPYILVSASEGEAVDYAYIYGLIVSVGSLGIYLESIWTKVHQAGGNMLIPMIAQIAGAVTNIALDPVLIFGMGPVPEMGIAGAAYATVAGQIVAAVITGLKGRRNIPKIKEMKPCIKSIYMLGYPSIFMQSMYTVYIAILNVILAGFSDAAVTVLGLYYKLQTFFFIPLAGLQTCIVPVISYNYALAEYDRAKKILKDAVIISLSFMLLGAVCFETIPDKMIGIFSRSGEVREIGMTAFRIIGISFLPAVFSLMMPVFFQAIGKAVPSVLLALTRQIFCLIPIFWICSQIGLNYSWLAFPISETIAGSVGCFLYKRETGAWKKKISARRI